MIHEQVANASITQAKEGYISLMVVACPNTIWMVYPESFRDAYPRLTHSFGQSTLCYKKYAIEPNIQKINTSFRFIQHIHVNPIYKLQHKNTFSFNPHSRAITLWWPTTPATTFSWTTGSLTNPQTTWTEYDIQRLHIIFFSFFFIMTNNYAYLMEKFWV